MTLFSIVSLREIETFTVSRGRVLWTRLAAACEQCGCEIHTGRQPDEGDAALLARLGKGRTAPVAGVLACRNCRREYVVNVEGEA